MNLKFKNSLIITSTLLLGILIGILICGRFTKAKLNNMRNFYTEKGFRKQVISIVKPNKEQLKELEPVFKENRIKNRQLIMEFKNNKKQLFNEFKTEASKILTPWQIKKLESIESKYLKKRMYKNKIIKLKKRK